MEIQTIELYKNFGKPYDFVNYQEFKINTHFKAHFLSSCKVLNQMKALMKKE